MPDEIIQLRHSDPAKKNARVPRDAYAVAHRTVLAVVPKNEPGITLAAYLDEMTTRLSSAKGWDPALSARWYAMAMKLDLEARGELKRINAKPPQRLIRTQPGDRRIR
jgi:hypothetical protein